MQTSLQDFIKMQKQKLRQIQTDIIDRFQKDDEEEENIYDNYKKKKYINQFWP